MYTPLRAIPPGLGHQSQGGSKPPSTQKMKQGITPGMASYQSLTFSRQIDSHARVLRKLVSSFESEVFVADSAMHGRGNLYYFRGAQSFLEACEKILPLLFPNSLCISSASFTAFISFKCRYC